MNQPLCEEPECGQPATHVWGSRKIDHSILPEKFYCANHVPPFGYAEALPKPTATDDKA